MRLYFRRWAPPRRIRLASLWLAVATACAEGRATSSSASTSVALTPASSPASPSLPGAEPAAVTALRSALRDHYSYRDRLGIDWKSAIEERAADLAEAPDAASFAKIVGEILARARDSHITIEIAGQPQRLATYVPKPAFNFALPTLERVVTRWKVRTRCLVTGSYEEFAYFLITHWESARCGDIGADFAAALADAKDAKAMILDVRANAGGDERLAASVAGRFIEEPRLYAKHVSVVPSVPGTFGPMQERVLAPTAVGWSKPVVTLMGPVCASSNEAFLLMMRAAGSKLVGQRSSGASGNPQPHKLCRGRPASGRRRIS